MVPHIRRVMNNPHARVGVTGASFGAFHAANQFFRRPDLFDTLVAMSGFYDLEPDYTDEPMRRPRAGAVGEPFGTLGDCFLPRLRYELLAYSSATRTDGAQLRTKGDRSMSTKAPLLPSQRVVQICLFLVATISMIGGPLQMVLGEPETTQRLDNVHRFLAGIYWGGAFIALWSGITIRQHRTLPFLLALSPFLGGLGRVVSILHVGLPSPAGVWIGYLVPELTLPVIIVVAQLATNRRLAHGTPQGESPRARR